ncbi:MAG TPA: Ig-like domain-containing protein, partial [Mycobacteriales bacterium]|nr:Ig-like domain-containing protein [Mycobacteriales bacterium]
MLLLGIALAALAAPAAAADGVAITSAPDRYTSASSLTWSGTLPDGATAECRVVTPGGTTVQDCTGTGSFSVTVDAAASGDYTLTVTAQLPDGTPAGSDSSTVTVDRTPPSVAITGSPVSPSADRSPTWTLAISGGSGTCTLTGSGFTSGPSSCSTSYTAALGSAPEGSYVLTVVATDEAGNEASATSDPYVLDVPPPAPTVGGPPATGNSATVAWTFTVPSGTTARCTLTAPNGTVTSADPCTSPWSTTLPSDGSFTASVVLVETSGGATSEPGTRTYVLDRVPPPAPAVTGSEGRTADPSLRWTFSPGDNSAVCRFEVNGALGTETGCSSPWTTTVSADGTYRLQVVLIDAAGNRSTAAWSPAVEVDRVPPPTPTITSAPTSPNNGGSSRSFTWNHTVAELTSCRILFGSTVVQDWAPCTGSVTFSTSGRPDGTYTLEVQSRDDLGNAGGVARSSVILDATAPGAPTVATPPGPSSARTLTVTFSGEPSTTATCTLRRGSTVVDTVSGCLSGHTFDLTGGADGTYSVDVVLRDAAGNDSPAGTSSYLLDTTAPDAPKVSVPAGVSSSRALTVTFSGEAGATATCTLRLGSTTLRTVEGCVSGLTFDLSGMDDGTYTVTVTLRDAAGNVSQAGTADYRLDTTPPLPPSVLAPVGPSRSRSWTVTFSGEPGATASCVLLRGSTVVTTVDGCLSGHVFDLTGLPDGTYTVEVRLTDAAGNTSDPGTRSYLLDTTPPAAPSVSAVAGPSNVRSWTVTFSGEPGATASCALLRGSTVVTTVDGCLSGHVFDLTGLPDGTYTVEVRLTDAAGNISDPGTRSYVLDTTPPTVPVFTVEPPTSFDSRPTWEFGSDADATLLCRLFAPDGTVLTDGLCSSPFTQNLSGRPDGSYLLEVRARDAVGNVSAPARSTFVLDTRPPAVPTVVSAPATSNSLRPTWELRGDADAVLLCRLVAPGGAVVVDGLCSPTFTPDLTGHPDGLFRLEVRARDAAGNVSDAVLTSYLLDTLPPAVPTFTRTPATSSDRAPRWEFNGDDGAVLLCRLRAPGGAVLFDGQCVDGAFVADLTGRADGDYLLEVRARDAAGNVSSPAGSVYVLDTTPPAAPVVTAAPGPSNARSWTVSFTSEAGSTASCVLRRGSTVVASVAGCTSGVTFDLTGQPDGTYTVTVELVDAAGNRSQAATASYLLDTTPPAAPVVTATPGPSSSRSWQVSFTGESGTTASCVLRRGGEVVRTVAACTSPVVFDLTGLPDGTYTVEVELVDAAGNRSRVGSASYELDTTAPAVPVFTAVPSTSFDRAPRWEFTGPADGVLLCRLYAPDGTLLVDTLCTGTSFTADLAGRPDGTYTLELRARDAAGNVSAPVTSAFVLDTVAPSVPVFTREPPTSFRRTPTWEVGSDADAVLLCTLRAPDGTVLVDRVCSSPFTADLTGLPDGTYTLEVRARDAAGNVSAPRTSTFVLDTVPPAAPVFTVEPPTSSNRFPRWELTTEAGTVLLCRLTGPDGAVLVDAACTSPVVADLTGRPDGSYLLTVTARDAAGNLSPSVTSTFVLDTVAPSRPVFTSVPPATSSGRAPTWTFTGDADAVLECRLYGPSGALGGWAPCAGTYTADLAEVADGSYSLRVRARDAAGNVSELLVGNYLLDTVPPAAVVITAPGSPSSGRTPTWTFSGEPGATLQCRVLGGTWQTCDAGGSFTLDLRTAADGTYTIEVRAVDAAGNVGPSRTSSYVLDTTAPSVPVFSVQPPTSFDRFPRWEFASEAGAVLLCRLTGPGGTVLLDGVCSSPLTADLTGRPDGTYTLEVRARDAAGNVSAPASSTFVLDTVPPAVPVLTSPVTPGSSRTPVWGIAAEGAPSCRLLGPGGAVVLDWAACGPSFAPDLTGRPDGTYTAEVRSRDAAGNVSGTASSSYRLDTTPPPAPGVTAPPSPSTSPGLVWTVTSTEAGTTAWCRVLRDGAVLVDWAVCTASTTGSPYPFDLSGRPDGAYRLEVRLVDAAGNVGPVSGATYVYDTTAPAPVGITPPPSPGSTRTPTWTFTTEAGARLECRAGDTGAYVLCGTGGTFSLNLSGAPDGTYAIWVRAVDAAGNVGAASRSVYVLDTTAPAAPVVTAPASPAQSRTPAWQWTGEQLAGTWATCVLTLDGAPFLRVERCTSAWTVPLGADGLYTLRVTLTDAAGNRSEGGTASYRLDTTAPETPEISGPQGPSNVAEAKFKVIAEAGAALRCRVTFTPRSGGTPTVGSWYGCTDSPTFRTGTTAGSYLLEVTATDAAGNVSEVADFVYEFDPNGLAGLDPVVPADGNNRRPTWTFTTSEGTWTTCVLTGPGSTGVLDSRTCDGSYRADLRGRPDGVYRLTITIHDVLGNASPHTFNYKLDTTPPPAPVVSTTPGIGSNPLVTWTWAGTEAGATYTCQLFRNGTAVTTRVPCSSPWTTDLTRFGEGTFTMQVVASDQYGNRSDAGTQHLGSYVWDATPPPVGPISSSAGTSGTARQVTFTFLRAAPGTTATCTVSRNGQFVSGADSCRDGRFDLDLTGQPDGRYDLVVRYRDAAGNESESRTSYTLSSVRPAPPAPPAPAPAPA